MHTVYVSGHRNPDTDAICSAIGYADFLRRTGRHPGAKAVRCGDVPARTMFALDYAGMEPPELVLDVQPTARRICRRDVISVQAHESLADVYRKARQHKLKSIPVMREDGKLAGMVTLHGLLEVLLPVEEDPLQNRKVDSCLERIRAVLNGSFLHAVDVEREEVMLQLVGAMGADTFECVMKMHPARQLILVCGNRPTIQRATIAYGVRCLVVTGGHALHPELLAMARERDVSVLSSPWDTATTTLLIRTARRIDPAVETDYLAFSPDATVRQIQQRIRGRSDPLFPVVDGQGRLFGVFSKTDLINPDPVKLVLVDHNELSQAVQGAASANIIEVIDHHRLGGSLNSSEPIRFTNEPVGSTCTIVAHFFKQAGMEPDRPVAICLMAGIISDTLAGTSPTTTQIDKDLLGWLSGLTGVDVGTFAGQFFAAGSVLESASAEAAVNMDCKAYEEDGWSFSISQIEENGLDRFDLHKADLKAALEIKRAGDGHDFACLFITDIVRHVSLLMLAGNEQVKEQFGYPLQEPEVYLMDDVVSRKKQLLPHIIEVLRGLDQDAMAD
jgi:manganese-dependent inorganic pyrophosphatase